MFNLVEGLYCTLRRPNLEDQATMARWMKDPFLNETVFDEWSFEGGAKRQARTWIEHNAQVYGSDTLVAIADTTKNRVPIGLVLFTNIDWKSRTADLRYLIGETKYRTSIFGPEMVLLGLQLAFNVLNMRKLYGYVLSGNKDPITLASFGGREEWVLKNYLPSVEGWHDYHLYCMFKTDFRDFVAKNRDGVLRRHVRAGLIK